MLAMQVHSMAKLYHLELRWVPEARQASQPNKLPKKAYYITSYTAPLTDTGRLLVGRNI